TNLGWKKHCLPMLEALQLIVALPSSTVPFPWACGLWSCFLATIVRPMPLSSTPRTIFLTRQSHVLILSASLSRTPDFLSIGTRPQLIPAKDTQLLPKTRISLLGLLQQ